MASQSVTEPRGRMRGGFPVVLVALAVVPLAGCNGHEESAYDYIQVNVHNEYGNQKVLIRLENPWYEIDYGSYSSTDFLCDRWRENPDWWLRATAKTLDGREIGTGNWTRMECKADYDLFLRPDGTLELALTRAERGYHEEPVPVP